MTSTPSDVAGDGEDVFVFPASYAQRRLWLIDQLEPGQSTYNIPLVLRLSGPLDVGAVRASLTHLVERHEALRTVFEARDGEPMQVVRPPAAVPLPLLPIRRAALEAAVHAEANRPFDLAAGPVLRGTLFELSAEEHALVLVVHHIATDGWSIGILLRELAAAYDAFANGGAPTLPELPLQYADYAVWQHEWLAGEMVEAQSAYWRERLAAPLPVLELPGDHGRSSDEPRFADRVEVKLSGETSEAVRTIAREANATPFMVLLAAFQLLLGRIAGQEEIIVGTPIAGRAERDLEGVIGFFVNTLALRTRLDARATFRELLADVRETTLGAFANSDVPFERVVEVVQPERDRARNPIFQALFSVQDLTSTEGVSMRGLQVSKQQAMRETAKFDVQLLLNGAGGTFRGQLEYDASVLDAETASVIAAGYAVLLDAIVADPDLVVADLPVVSAAGIAAAVVAGTGPGAPRDDRSVSALFAAQARRTPDVVAVKSSERAISYAALDDWSSRVARGLVARGVSRDVCVGVCIERSVEMVVAVLAILKAGGAYVPIDPAYPAARIRYMLENAAIDTVLVSDATRGGFADFRVSCQDLKSLSGAEDAMLPTVDADALAYVIYTSGSTGAPKGVAMPHRALGNLLAWQRRDSRVREGAPTLQFASLSFDVSFQEIFSTWCTGGTLILTDEATRRDPDALLRLLERERIERLFLPYIALQHLADAAGGSEGAVSSLREVITAGEQLRVTPAIRSWMGAMPGCILVNQYGPTESHVVTSYTLPGSADAWDELPPIGAPIANARAYILDGAGQPAAPGVRGELFLGGDVLARGYLASPERTAERFLADQFAGDPTARMYRTGDMARRRRDGAIEYLGRIDGQVKLRGYRIELGEVEAVIARDESVAACAATVREDAPGERRLVAYVVAASSEMSTSALRDRCRRELPEFMVPAAIVSIEALPLTPSGKIDRRALPAVGAGNGSARETAPLETETERSVASIWSELLRIEAIGRYDNFFELGGHSLIATRMVSRVRDRLGRDVPLRALFDAPVLAEFCQAVERTEPAQSAARASTPIMRAAFRRGVEGGMQ